PSHEATFFVQGNCEACSEVIREGVESVSGATFVGWNPENSMVLVTYRGDGSVVDSIQKHVAQKGFETQFYPADSEARAALPDCCKESKSRFSMPQEEHPSE
ncbi:MAG: heavy-metal-associated domain-containing protein, partial [Bacteroidota bacterium]